jgi:nucleoside-diphosphate-sugar epimerase
VNKKKILIIGKTSYIGTNFMNWLRMWPEEYEVKSISVRSSEWKSERFVDFDVILHVAGIVHIKERKEMWSLYDQVNRELPIEVCRKAKNEGVKHFIFLSTMAVYGLDGELNKEVIINNHTNPLPESLYGQSKLEAEMGLLEFADQNFIVSIGRPPMVYGNGCPGNYMELRKWVLRIPILPMIENQRSMIFVNNLCQYIKCLADKTIGGIHHPQIGELISTSELAAGIARINNKRLVLSPFLGKVIFLIRNLKIVRKLFGNLVYDKRLSNLDCEFIETTKSIELSEKGFT